MEPRESKHPSVSEELSKKVYRKPRLEVYGDLGQITLASTTGGRTDANHALRLRPSKTA